MTMASAQANARALVADQRVLVLGSAPGTIWPEKDTADRVVCANGAAGIARDAGRPVDVWCLSGEWPLCRMAIDPDVRFVRGVTVSMVLCILNRPHDATTTWLTTIGCSYRTLQMLTAWHRAAIVEAVCGPLGIVPSNQRVSTGVFAACWAMWGGARIVVLAGISLHPGYAYRPDPLTIRTHQVGDLRCLPILRDRYRDRIQTTSQELVEYGFGHV